MAQVRRGKWTEIGLRSGLRVRWAFDDAFPGQVAIMEKLTSALIDGVKGVMIDSPTGTGKTMAMLTSTLAFVDAAFRGRSDRPTVYFTSPKHTQLEQMIKEYRKTPYSTQLTMAVLGSRSTLCINSAVCNSASVNDEWYVCTVESWCFVKCD